MDNIAFKLYNGDILGIIGPNGARNTTLFRCILENEYEYYGNILIFNKDIRKNKNVFQKIGYVLDGSKYDCKQHCNYKQKDVFS